MTNLVYSLIYSMIYIYAYLYMIIINLFDRYLHRFENRVKVKKSLGKYRFYRNSSLYQQGKRRYNGKYT